MEQNKIKIGITHGDINGIGYEIIIKSFQDARLLEICTPIVYGSPKILAYHRKVLNIPVFNSNNIKEVSEASEKKINIINVLDDNVKVELGKSTRLGGESAFISLERAVQDLKENKIDAILTAPINKDNIQSPNFKFPGHTEYLAEKFDSKNHLMLLVDDELRVGVVTGHIPISEVPKAITKELILEKLRVMNNSLKKDFGIRKPRIAVFGLNPHCGDNGVIGNEEIETIIPAIETAKAESIAAFGPYPSDGFFGSSGFTKFDGILAMYHDQGLTPFKALAIDGGVNFTAGLSIIRTSPSHGTAYDIAGEGKAKIESFRKAIYLACDIYKNRMFEKEISENPLQISAVKY